MARQTVCVIKYDTFKAVFYAGVNVLPKSNGGLCSAKHT